jgi:hypothetical protein
MILSLLGIVSISSAQSTGTTHHLGMLSRRRLNATMPDDISLPIEFDLSSIHGVYDWTTLLLGNNGTEEEAYSDFSSGFRLFRRRDTPLDTVLLSGTINNGNDFVATLRMAGNASMMYQNSEDGQHRSLGAVPVGLEHIYWTEKVCLAETVAPDCPTIGKGAFDVEESVRTVLSDATLQLGVVSDCQPMCGSSPTVILEGPSGSLVGVFARHLDSTSSSSTADNGATSSSTESAVLAQNNNVVWWTILFVVLAAFL